METKNYIKGEDKFTEYHYRNNVITKRIDKHGYSSYISKIPLTDNDIEKVYLMFFRSNNITRIEDFFDLRLKYPLYYSIYWDSHNKSFDITDLRRPPKYDNSAGTSEYHDRFRENQTKWKEKIKQNNDERISFRNKRDERINEIKKQLDKNG